MNSNIETSERHGTIFYHSNGNAFAIKIGEFILKKYFPFVYRDLERQR